MSLSSILCERARAITHFRRSGRTCPASRERLHAQPLPGRSLEMLEARVLLAADISFVAARSFATGVSPSSVFVADFNGDKLSDVAVTDSLASGKVRILLNTGNGTLQENGNYSVGLHPTSVAGGDFNGDGHRDLAVVSMYSSQVNILLGNGDGSFQMGASIPVGSNPFAVAAADFNGDGFSDLAVTSANGTTVAILLGNGNGTFSSLGNCTVGNSPQAICVGDFNGDGRMDVATANFNSHTVSILLGNGNGTFQSKSDYAVGFNPDGITVADFNGDGKLDIVTANSYANTTSILLGNGDGTFQAKSDFTVGINPKGVVAEDFNGDGQPDLATVSYGCSTVSVLLNNGNGTFQNSCEYVVGIQPGALAKGDFNGDGRADLVTADIGTNTVSVLQANGNGTFQGALDLPVGAAPESAVVGDFNRDARSDLALLNNSNSTVTILLGDGNGGFQLYSTVVLIGYPNTAAQGNIVEGDLNNDSYLDLVVANTGPGRVSVLLGKGDGTFQNPITYSVGFVPYFVTIGDFNADRHPDLVVAHEPSTVSVLLGNGDGSFGSPIDSIVRSAPSAIAVGDFNSDGRDDLAVTNSAADSVSVLLGNGNGTFQIKVNYSVGNSPTSLALADFNRDGVGDLAVSNPGNHTVSILLGRANGTFQNRVDYTVSRGAKYLTQGDFNSDGNIDLAVVNISGSVSILEGDGSGAFQNKGYYDIGSAPSRFVTTGDIDGDGRIDLVMPKFTQIYTQCSVAILFNNSGDFAVQNINKTLAPDTPLVFSTSDFTAACTPANATLQNIKIVSLPGRGNLTLNSINVAVDQEILTSDLATLVYTPATGYTGTDSFQWNGSDGLNYASTPANVNLNIVQDAPPTDIALLPGTVAENQPAGTLVGTLSTSDLDIGDTFTYTLVSGSGSSDNANFTISGNHLLSAAAFNYETQNSYSIRVRSTDAGGLYFEKSLVVAVTNVNEAPTLSPFSKFLAPDSSLTFAAGDFTATFSDPDAGDTLQKIKLTGLPSHGAFKLNNVAATLNQELTTSQLADLVYRPAAGYAGTDSFGWNASDRSLYAASPSTVTLQISNSPPPVVTDLTVNGTTGQRISFAASDFAAHYTNNGGGALAGVMITSLPTYGTLTLGVSQTLQPIAANAASFFDEAFYRNLYPDVARAVQSGVLPSGWYHFQRWGITEGRQPSTIYSETFYLENYPDVALAVAQRVFRTGFDHFVLYGFKETRTGAPNNGGVAVNQEIPPAQLSTLVYTPAPGFTGADSFGWNGSDGTLYADLPAAVNLQISAPTPPTVSAFTKNTATNQPLAFAPADFASHFSPGPGGALTTVKITQLPTHGVLTLAGTNLQPASGAAASFFDEAFYLRLYPDVAQAVQAGTIASGWYHFQRWGVLEGRQPSSSYDEIYYLTHNPDVARAVVQRVFRTGFAHFVQYGFQEGRRGALNTIALNQELSAAQLANLVYTPAPGYTGADTFRWTAANANGYAVSPALVTITVA